MNPLYDMCLDRVKLGSMVGFKTSHLPRTTVYNFILSWTQAPYLTQSVHKTFRPPYFAKKTDNPVDFKKRGTHLPIGCKVSLRSPGPISRR